MTFSDEAIKYADLTGPWGAFRLVFDGIDVTRFRGVPAQIGGYQLTEPYSFGPAEFAFPQVTTFDTPGAGEIPWLRNESPVQLVQVDEAGNLVRTVWRGFVSRLQARGGTWEVYCSGELSGRLDVRDKHAEPHSWTKDIGTLVADAIRKVGLSPSPFWGLDTGIEVDERGRVGTYLTYMDALLAECQTVAGEQLTVLYNGSKYESQWKDRATIAATFDNGGYGVELEVADDLTETPNTFYGFGRNSKGRLWDNVKRPGLIQGDPPPFPGVMAEGDSGEYVDALQLKLIAMGYLDRDDMTEGGTFDDETAEAVEALQDDAGLAQTGIVNEATWNALFDLNVTDFSLRHAKVFPLAQDPEVREKDYSANGSVIGDNDAYDPSRIQVDQTIDWGICRERRARRWSKRQLERNQTEPNWSGVVTFGADLLAGEHVHGTTPTGLLSRLDITPGMNLLCRYFDGGTVFHVAGVNVSSDLTVRCAIDTKARDLLTLAQIIERNRASRNDPARQWRRERRQTGAHHAIPQWTKGCGLLTVKLSLPANKWTVFPVVAGQSGSITQLRVRVQDSACEHAVVVTSKKVTPDYMDNYFPAPLDDPDTWRSEKAREIVDDEKQMLVVVGGPDQPGGYHDGKKTGDDGEPTGDPVTGKTLDAGGMDYWTDEQPVLYVAVFPKQACVMKPQRVLDVVLESGM